MHTQRLTPKSPHLKLLVRKQVRIFTPVQHYRMENTLRVINKVSPVQPSHWRNDNLRSCLQRQDVPVMWLLPWTQWPRPGTTWIDQCAPQQEPKQAQLKAPCLLHEALKKYLLSEGFAQSFGEDYKGMLSSFSLFLRKLPPDLPKKQRLQDLLGVFIH